jgi:hypothetical protein
MRSQLKRKLWIFAIATVAAFCLGWWGTEIPQAWADTVTYYFNSYDSVDILWDARPQDVVDNDPNPPTTWGESNSESEYMYLNGNSCPGTNLGTITDVELSVWFANNFNNGVDRTAVPKLIPYFNGTTLGADYYDTPGDYDPGPIQGAWHSIEADAAGPGSGNWTWSDVQNLQLKLSVHRPLSGRAEPFKVEIRVTYSSNSAPSAPQNPYCEGVTNPTGVKDLTPEFSAVYDDPNTSDTAEFYEIEVDTASTFDGTRMWDTGKTPLTSLAENTRMPDVSYAGTPLSQDGSKYYWRIRFWDNSDAQGAWSTTQEFTMWWNASWGRRAPVTITYSGSALTNHQVKVDVTYDADMQSDFDDIRFVDSDNSTELDYYRESDYIASTSAVFWVEVPSIPDGGKTIYMYYENSSVSTTSSGPNTFEYFEDFETSEGYSTGSVNGQNGWVSPVTGSTGHQPGQIENTNAFSGTQQLEHYYPTNWDSISSEKAVSLGTDRLIDARICLITKGDSGTADTHLKVVDLEGDEVRLKTRREFVPNGETNWLAQYDGTAYDSGVAFSAGSYVRVQIGIFNGGTMDYWIGGTQVYNDQIQSFDEFQEIKLYADEKAGIRFDEVFIRRYVSSEPSTSVGPEEGNDSADLQQIHYRWRNDLGGELGALDTGDGADGALAPTGTFNLNTDTSGGRSYADGIAYRIDASTATGTSVESSSLISRGYQVITRM